MGRVVWEYLGLVTFQSSDHNVSAVFPTDLLRTPAEAGETSQYPEVLLKVQQKRLTRYPLPYSKQSLPQNIIQPSNSLTSDELSVKGTTPPLSNIRRPLVPLHHLSPSFLNPPAMSRCLCPLGFRERQSVVEKSAEGKHTVNPSHAKGLWTPPPLFTPCHFRQRQQAQTRPIPLSEASKTGFGGGMPPPQKNHTICFASPFAVSRWVAKTCDVRPAFPLILEEIYLRPRPPLLTCKRVKNLRDLKSEPKARKL